MKNMKNLIVLVFAIYCSLFTPFCFSQGVGVNTTGTAADNSAMLDISSTTQGLLIPRITTAQRNSISTPALSLLIFNITTNCFEAYVNGSWYSVSCPPPCTLPSTPTTGISAATHTDIVWNWNSVNGATGYAYGTADDYSSSVNNGTNTSYTQTGLIPNTTYTLYIWAYNACGSSTTPGTLIQTTLLWDCGGTFTVTYTPGINGVPLNSPTTITYGTTNYYKTQTGVCWLTKSLGATIQPTSIYDSRSAASGWYFQYNRSQGYDMANDGVTIIPSSGWTTTSTPYPSGWDSANDPCTIQLGTGWRLPTWSEFYPLPWGWNHDNCAANSSPLAIAGSGYLDLSTSTPHLYLRGSTSCDLSTYLNSGAPFYWSSSVYPYYPSNGNIGAFWTPGWTYMANQNWLFITNAHALAVRCVHL
jgi:hypothetical protein